MRNILREQSVIKRLFVCENMKFTIAILSLVCCGCLASGEAEKQKRSVGFYDGLIGGSYGLDSSISSHTHTHTTSVIEKPVILPSTSITTTKVISPAIQSSFLPSYSSAYNFGGWPSSSYGGWPSSYGKIYSGFDRTYPSYSYGKFAPSFGKYYSSGSYGWPTQSIYPQKSYYSSPVIKYKW